VSENSKKFGLNINEKKAKTMSIGKEETELNISLDGNKLEQVKVFVLAKLQKTQRTIRILKHILH